MKFRMLALSLLLVFSALLTMTALSVNWDDPTYSAEEMFHSGEEERYVNPVGAPATPQEARELQKNKSSMNWTMPSTLTGSGDSAKEAREEAQSSGEAASADASQPSAGQAGAADVQGTWFFTLNDTLVRDAALTLFQNGQEIYGSGRIKEGNNSLDVAASGSVAGSTMILNLISANPVSQYKLNLTLDQGWAAGDYRASSASGESWMGRAEGQKTA